MATGLILGGLGLAVFGFAGRYAVKNLPQFAKSAKDVLDKSIPSGALSKYYRGGFEPKMSRREAGLVLGVSPSVSKAKLKEAHKRIMLLNHPDKGGSPYLAAKINEAKDHLESNKQ